MYVFNYHPWTMIYLNLPPSIGLIANWTQWSEAETNLIEKVKSLEPHQKMTILNFILPKMKMPIVSVNGIKSLGEKENIAQLINYSVPKALPQQSPTLYLNNFEPLKNMLHLNKIYILKSHPLLKQMKKIYQQSQIEIIDLEDKGVFLNRLKKDLSQGKMEDYHHLVGANYSFRGPVVSGAKNGKKIGYPTANLLMKPPLPIRSGVYLVKVNLPNEQQKRWGLGDYRKLPNNDWVFEVFILDFNQEIYGWVITIELVAFHRSNVPFKSLEQIKGLIKADETALRALIPKFKEQ